MARPLEPSAPETAAFHSEGGRFAIETDEPHVKVAWRITGRKEQPQEEERR